jgi:hypothetical protein
LQTSTNEAGGSVNRALAQRLEESVLRDRALIVFGLPLTAAFRQDVLLVRPTRAEGDALRVRDALHARVPGGGE